MPSCLPPFWAPAESWLSLESGQEGVKGWSSSSQVSIGASNCLELEFPLKGGYNRGLHYRCWGGHYIATSSGRFVGSLLNSGRKGKRGVKNDSKVTWLETWEQNRATETKGSRLKWYKWWGERLDAPDHTAFVASSHSHVHGCLK